MPVVTASHCYPQEGLAQGASIRQQEFAVHPGDLDIGLPTSPSSGSMTSSCLCLPPLAPCSVPPSCKMLPKPEKTDLLKCGARAAI